MASMHGSRRPIVDARTGAIYTVRVNSMAGASYNS